MLSKRRKFVLFPCKDLAKNSAVSEDGQTASRCSALDCYSNAVVTVDTPVPVVDGRAYFEVLISGWMEKWSGSLKMKFFGVVTSDITHDDLYYGADPTTGSADVREGMRIGILYDQGTHKMCYFRNGAEFGTWFKLKRKLTEDKLWPCVYLYGRTTSITLIQPLEWSLETHRGFSREFRSIVKTLLLCNRRQDGNLVSILPKFVLLDEIFPFLGGLYEADRLPDAYFRK